MLSQLFFEESFAKLAREPNDALDDTMNEVTNPPETDEAIHLSPSTDISHKTSAEPVNPNPIILIMQQLRFHRLLIRLKYSGIRITHII